MSARVICIRSSVALLLLSASVGSCARAGPAAIASPPQVVPAAAPAGPTAIEPVVKGGGARLFLGAPPVIPHPLDGDYDQSAMTCLDCHETGGDVDVDKPAPATAHPELELCRTCHLTREGERVDAIDSNFEGFFGGRRGARLYAGAPPTIPHGVGVLYARCVACHAGDVPRGPVTPHPERELCRQCHVPSDSGAAAPY